MGIVLASGSPRRKELLEGAGIGFRVVISPAEEIHDESMAPEKLCETNAELKAEAVASVCPGDVVIGADTLVFVDGRALGKPKDMAAAAAMLRMLSGRTHRVCSGVCVIFPGGKREIFHGLTEVDFRELDDAIIDGYFARVNPLDKAGAYGIQEYGEMLVREIRGSFENVMGLPVEMVIRCLAAAGGPAEACGGKWDGGESAHGGVAPLSADL